MRLRATFYCTCQICLPLSIHAERQRKTYVSTISLVHTLKNFSRHCVGGFEDEYVTPLHAQSEMKGTCDMCAGVGDSPSTKRLLQCPSSRWVPSADNANASAPFSPCISIWEHTE